MINKREPWDMMTNQEQATAVEMRSAPTIRHESLSLGLSFSASLTAKQKLMNDFETCTDELERAWPQEPGARP
jgi:hypothetical protein